MALLPEDLVLDLLVSQSQNYQAALPQRTHRVQMPSKALVYTTNT